MYKSNPITGLDMPIGFQELEAPRFQDIRHMNVVRLSVLFTTQEIFLVLISVRGCVNPRAIMWPERLCLRKIPMIHGESNLRTCSIVSQTATTVVIAVVAAAAMLIAEIPRRIRFM
jgi:hypothetical protein